MMKKLFLLFFMFVLALTVMAQSTQKITYQAVVRDGANRLVVNTPVKVDVTITYSSGSYFESLKDTTNANGLMYVLIGGNPGFESINWENALIKTVVTIDGRETVTDEVAVTAVPYALQANYADSVNVDVIAHYIDSHALTIETDPTVPAWAKESTKPNYDYSEIQNTPDLTVYATNVHLNDTLSYYYTDKKINDTLSHYLTQEVQVLSVSNDTLYLTGGSWVKLPKGFSGDYNDLTNRPDLTVYATNVHLDDTLSYYFDTTQVKTAIHDTADAIRAAIPAQVNADWNATSGKAEILNKPTIPTTVAELSDAANYTTNAHLNDTLSHYYDTTQVNQTLKQYLKSGNLCDSVMRCTAIQAMQNDIVTNTTNIDVNKHAITDSSAHIRNDIKNGKITIALISGTETGVTNPTFGVNQDTNQTVTINIPEAATVNNGQLTIIAAGDTTRFTANQATNDTVDLSNLVTKARLNDTLKAYTTSDQIDTLLDNYLTIDGLCDSIEKNCTNVALKNKDNLFTLRNQFDSTVFFKDATQFDSTAYFKERAYFDKDVNVKGDVIFKGYNYYFSVNNFYEHDAIVLIDEAVNPTTLGPVQSTPDVNLNRRLAVNYNDLMVVYDTLKKTAQNADAALAARIVADSNRLEDFKDKVHDDSLLLAQRIHKDSVTVMDTLHKYYATKDTLKNFVRTNVLCAEVMNCTAIQTMQNDIATNTTNIGVNKQAIIDSSAHIRDDIKNGKITIAVNRSTTTTETTVTNPTFGVNQDTNQTVTITIPQETTVNNGQLTIIAAGDTTRFTANQATNDTVRLNKFATKDTLKNFVNKLAIRDSVNNIVKDSLAAPNSAINLAIDTIARHNISDSTRMVFDTLHYYYTTNAHLNDTLKHYTTSKQIDTLLGAYATRVALRDSTKMMRDTLHKYYATKDTLRNFVNKLALRDSVNNIVKDSLAAPNSAINMAIDTIARHNISDSTRMVFDTLHTYYATKDTLKNFLTINGLCDSVMKCDGIKTMRDSIQKVNAHVSADSLVLATKIHDDSLTLATKLHADSVDLAKHISDSTRMVFDTLHEYYATKKALKDTATAIRNDICDSATTCITKALADANSEINHAVDTIARNNIHDTAVAIRALIPTVPTNVNAFTNDAKYVNNASCDSLDFCALMAKVNAMATSMNNINNTINNMQHTIDSLEGVIDALSSLLPKVTLTTDKTTAPIGSGDVASVICTATLKNANGYTLYWKVDGTDSTSNHNTPLTVNFTTVGTHKIVCTAKQDGSPDLKDSVTITITKGTPTVNVTLATGLVYTGAPQALVTAGSTTGGTLQYKLNDGAYSTDIPEASAVGSYTVSYKVVGNDNWNDVDETNEDVTIAKMPINPTVSITGWTSCEPANIPSVTGNTGNAPVTYEYKVNGADDNTYGATIPVSAGEYTIRATVAETANYSAGVATADFTIAAGSGCEEPSGTPATILVAPTATPGTITSGTTTPLVTEGQAENGTMMYAVTTSAQPQLSDFSTTVPTAAALTAGTCYVWYYAQGIIPYNDSPIAGPIEVTVTPPPFSVGSNKKVYFAPANLQASTSDKGVNWTWQFAPNEWDYVGATALHNTRVQSAGTVKLSGEGKVDLFSWVGASNTTWSGELGTTLNAAMHGIADAKSTDSNYGSSASDVLKSDWGNTINDGHNWRTPTSEEWAYLLGIRASGSTVAGKNGNVSNARYTLAKINTDGSPVRGLIIFPDGITIEASEFTQAGFINREIGETSADTWEKGTLCTTAQWAALSAKGCVFLPTAGYRYHNPNENNPGVSGVTDASGYAGQYWSSSPSGTTTAYFVLFTRTFVDPRSSDHLLTPSERRFGLSVRLVRDAE